MITKGITRAGGAEEYLSDVVTGLSRLGHTVSIFYGNSLSEGETVIDRVSRISVLIKDFNKDELVTRLSQFNPDVVNFQNVVNSDLLRFISKLKPTTVFIHDHESYCPGNSKYFFNGGGICNLPISPVCALNGYLKKCMTRRPSKAFSNISERFNDLSILKLLKKVICNSNYIKSNLITNGVRKDSIFVNHLFPISNENIEIPKDIPRDTVPTILYVGRLFKEKGVDHLLKALALLKQPFRAVIAGDGWEKKNLMHLASFLGIESKIAFKGFCSRFEVANLYQGAYLLVVPSLWPEPFGLVGLEALSYRLPVVAYGSGGIPEWLDDGYSGFTVDRGNVNALAGKIDTLLGDRDLAFKLGTYGRNRVIKDFSLEKHLMNLVAVYEELCQRGI